jgi:hypothetical protein
MCENLGILVPYGDIFGLDTQIPSKRLVGGIPEFTLIPKHSYVSELFLPVFPEEPFAYIEKLKNAYLERKGNQLGIAIKEPGQ